MRKLTLLLVAVLGSNLYLLAEEPLLIRAYRAEPGNFKMFEMATGFGVFEIDKLKTFQARKIAKPPFESRFFSPEGSFLNYTPWARQVGLFDETSGVTILPWWNQRSG